MQDYKQLTVEPSSTSDLIKLCDSLRKAERAKRKIYCKTDNGLFPLDSFLQEEERILLRSGEDELIVHAYDLYPVSVVGIGTHVETELRTRYISFLVEDIKAFSEMKSIQLFGEGDDLPEQDYSLGDYHRSNYKGNAVADITQYDLGTVSDIHQQILLWKNIYTKYLSAVTLDTTTGVIRAYVSGSLGEVITGKLGEVSYYVLFQHYTGKDKMVLYLREG